MKARKRVIGIFLAVVVLCIGVGFAALADDLTVDGTVAVKSSTFDDTFDGYIFFSNGAVDETATTVTDKTAVTVGVANDDDGDANDKLTIAIGEAAFTAVDQVVVVTANIENSSPTNDANVAVTNFRNSATFPDPADTDAPFTVGSFEVSIALSNDGTVVRNNGTDNGTITVTITVKLTKLPTADESGVFGFKLTATAV